MALADTARLVASLELQDKFSATANKFDRTLGGMNRTLGQTATNLGRIGAIGFGVLTANVVAGIATIARLEEVTTATNAVIESTGGVAGQTAEDIRNLAEKYETLNATMDDKVIQSAENVLLTFTKITEDGFEPALEAALNLNQALGGGEEGLQGNIILVGKALNDPIRGLTALRRVGVSFTRAQEDQIRALTEANDLYGAQQVILEELEVEFGGQFAAAGDTATARFARFKDAIEDAQVALAGALLPALEKVGARLTDLLADPRTLAALEDVGEELADAFDSVVEIAGNLPWAAIGDSFRLMGTGAKALLTAFTALPPWVQTAVLTGWGLNKLTGGALTSLVGALASGLVRGILGINAGVVNINAATVNGPGGIAGGAGRGLGALGAAASGAAVAGTVVGGLLTVEDISSGTETGVSRGIQSLSGGPFAGLIARAIEDVIGDPLGDLLDSLGEGERNEKTRAQLQQHLLRENSGKIAESNRELVVSRQHLNTLTQKNFSPTVKVTTNVTSNVSITDITRRLVSQRISTGGTGGITIE